MGWRCCSNGQGSTGKIDLFSRLCIRSTRFPRTYSTKFYSYLWCWIAWFPKSKVNFLLLPNKHSKNHKTSFNLSANQKARVWLANQKAQLNIRSPSQIFYWENRWFFEYHSRTENLSDLIIHWILSFGHLFLHQICKYF